MFGLSNDYYFYHFETNSTYYLYSGIFCGACVSVIGERHAPARKKVLNVPRLWQKNSNAVEPTFKVRKVYEKVRIEQHLKKIGVLRERV